MWARDASSAAALATAPSQRRPQVAADQRFQKSQSSSSVTTALPITYDDPDPEKKSWFSSALGERADRIAGLTSVSARGNNASSPTFINALLALYRRNFLTSSVSPTSS